MKQVILIVLVCCATSLFAQQRFISSGKIEFEKKENVYKTIDMLVDEWGDDNGGWLEDVKKNTPQFSVNYFDLYFTQTKSLFKPGRDVITQNQNTWMQSSANQNIVATDLTTGFFTAQKDIYGSVFLIKDSARKVEWRITSETRDIAGFECRKAVGKLLDSIYVVAFYTDQILATGGPESFQGLPGMILGLAIPRLNTTWFATKLEIVPVTNAALAPPVKGKKNTSTTYEKTLVDLGKDWGKFGKRRILQAII